MDNSSSVGRTGITVVMLTLAYISLYELNALVMGTEAFNGVAAWVFLPAFVRLLGFLLVGFWSIPALFVAALFCVDLSLSPTSQVVVSIFLAVGAPIALGIASKVIGVEASLANLTGSRIFILSVAAALGSGAFYHIGLSIVGAQTHSMASFFTSALGDAAGTWVVIYTLKMLLTLASQAFTSKA